MGYMYAHALVHTPLHAHTCTLSAPTHTHFKACTEPSQTLTHAFTHARDCPSMAQGLAEDTRTQACPRTLNASQTLTHLHGVMERRAPLEGQGIGHPLKRAHSLARDQAMPARSCTPGVYVMQTLFPRTSPMLCARVAGQSNGHKLKLLQGNSSKVRCSPGCESWAPSWACNLGHLLGHATSGTFLHAPSGFAIPKNFAPSHRLATAKGAGALPLPTVTPAAHSIHPASRMHACKTHSCKMHACKTHACKMHACKTHACKTHAGKMHACKMPACKPWPITSLLLVLSTQALTCARAGPIFH